MARHSGRSVSEGWHIAEPPSQSKAKRTMGHTPRVQRKSRSLLAEGLIGNEYVVLPNYYSIDIKIWIVLAHNTVTTTIYCCVVYKTTSQFVPSLAQNCDWHKIVEVTKLWLSQNCDWHKIVKVTKLAIEVTKLWQNTFPNFVTKSPQKTKQLKILV